MPTFFVKRACVFTKMWANFINELITSSDIHFSVYQEKDDNRNQNSQHNQQPSYS